MSAGDELFSVDLCRVEGLDHQEVVRMVRGPPGTTVKLGFRRPSRTFGAQPHYYFITLERTIARPSMQRAFGTPRLQSGQSPTRTFLVM